MDDFLKKIPERQVYVLVASVFLLTLLASYFYLIKKPLAGYKGIKQTRILLQSKVATGGDLSVENRELGEEVNRLSLSLHGQGAEVPVNQMIARNVDQLDRLANRHDVELESVKPARRKTMRFFEEIPFTISVSGMYFNLYRWLHDVELELGPMVVKQLEILPKGKDRKLTMKLDMVYYVPMEQDL